MVSVKVLRNDKDCLDAGLGEVRVLALIARQDPQGEQQLLRLLDYFYFKEHLIIVTELLRDSLFQFYRYLHSTGRRLEYFSTSTLATLSTQLLHALAFLHDNGLAHCDVKPENVCVVSASRHVFKLIDFGSAVFQYDCHNSYVQSRWYAQAHSRLTQPSPTTLPLSPSTHTLHPPITQVPRSRGDARPIMGRQGRYVVLWLPTRRARPRLSNLPCVHRRGRPRIPCCRLRPNALTHGQALAGDRKDVFHILWRRLSGRSTVNGPRRLHITAKAARAAPHLNRLHHRRQAVPLFPLVHPHPRPAEAAVSARGIAAPVARAEPRRGGGASRRVAVTARRAIAFVHGRRPRRLRLVPLRQRLHV